MDVKEINNLIRTRVPSSQQKISEEKGFKEVLDGKISETGPVRSATQTATINGLLDQGDKLLSLLDTFSKELNDPRITLKDLQPLVENIEEEVNTFEMEAAEQGHELDGLVKDLAVIANVALIKFHRGDLV